MEVRVGRFGRESDGLIIFINFIVIIETTLNCY